ncbi:MAG: efflux transporter outer membrane subunit, partial [Pseudomonadota bacterium]|nr:efflux transporter outer membrane subunit [Pseudomonadota bacterium]
TTTTTYKATLSASWELDLWGRLRSGAAKAIADAQAAAADLAGARLSLQAKIVRAFYNAIDSRLQVELLEATTNNLEVSTMQIRARYERGLRPSFDVRLAESNLAGTRAALALRRRAHDTAVRQLELLLGRYPAAEIEISEQLPPMPQAIPSGLPAQLVSRRPDLAAAERRLVAADLLLGEARRALLPRISLTGSAGRSSEDLGDLLDGDFAVWNLIGNITMPLFQGGRLRRQVDAAVAGKEQEIASYAQRVLTAFAEVEQALVAEQLLSEQEAALRIASRQAAAAERLSQHRYRHGLSDLIAYLDAQRRTFEARSQLLTVQRQRLEARVSLHVALGGGFRFDNPPDNS